MTVNPVSDQSYLSLLNNPLTSSPLTTSSAGVDNTSTGVTSSLSNVAQFFNDLKQLSQQDPTQFKQITAEIAQQLSTDAQNSTNPSQAQALSSLASRFQQASQTGNFSSLLPQQQSNGTSSTGNTSAAKGHHHGHHHHGGYDADGDSSSSSQNPLASIVSSFAPQVQSALGSSNTSGS